MTINRLPIVHHGSPLVQYSTGQLNLDTFRPTPICFTSYNRATPACTIIEADNRSLISLSLSLALSTRIA